MPDWPSTIPLQTCVYCLYMIALQNFYIAWDYFPSLTAHTVNNGKKWTSAICQNTLLCIQHPKPKDTGRQEVEWVDDAFKTYTKSEQINKNFTREIQIKFVMWIRFTFRPHSTAITYLCLLRTWPILCSKNHSIFACSVLGFALRHTRILGFRL